MPTMTQRNPNDPETRLARIDEFIIEGLRDASPEELREILGEEFIKEDSERVLRLLEAAERQVGQKRLEQAKQNVVDFLSKVGANQRNVSHESHDLTERLEKLLTRDPALFDHMTFAARNGQPMSEQELRQLVEALELLQEPPDQPEG